MVLQQPRNLPPRLTPHHHPSAAHLQASEPQFPRPSPPASSSSHQPRDFNEGSIIPNSSRPFTRVEVLDNGNMRFFYADNTSTTTTPTSNPSGFSPRARLPQRSIRRPLRHPFEDSFTPFGIPAERTYAKRNEICPAFINPGMRCFHGSRCYRIHPHDKETYLQKIRNALAVEDLPATAESSHELEKEVKDMDSKDQKADTDLSKPPPLPDASKSPPQESPSPPTKELPPPESSQEGWDDSGSWMGIPKAESWSSISTTSLGAGADLLSSVSSGSSSPTTASPDVTDDEKVEGPAPTPALTRTLGTTVCVMFKKSGKCPRGKNCMFKHVQETTVPPPKPPSPQPKVKNTATLASFRASVPSVSASVVKKPPPTAVPPVKTPTPSTPSVTASPAKTSAPSVATSATATPTSSVAKTLVKAPVPPQPAAPNQSIVPAAPVRPPEKLAPPQSRVRHPRPQSGQLCHRWLQNICSYGYSCRWVHGDLEYDGEPVKQPLASTPTSAPASTSNEEFLLSMTLHDHMRVQCSAGLDIQRIQTAFESSTLLVSNISHRVRPGHLRETLSSYGMVEDIRMPPTFSTGTVVKVTYSDAASAQKAQNALNGSKMHDLTITAKVANSGNIMTATNALLKDTCIRIAWEAPAKEVYAGYANRVDAEKAIQIARESPLNGHYLRGEIYEGMPAVDVVNVRFRGVPIDVDKADLVRFVNPVDVMWTRPNYTELEDATRFIKSRLREFDYESIDILPPPYRDGGMVRAWAAFPSASKAKDAARRLENRQPKCTGFTPIRATHVQSLSYVLSQEKWGKVGAGIDILQASYRGRLAGVYVTRREAGGRYVRLSGDDQKELAHLKNQFEQILKGEVVRCDGKVVYDSYFTRWEGAQFLRDLSTKNPSVYYENDPSRPGIRLHGYITDRVRFANAIVAKVKEFRSQQKLDIPLPGRLLGAALGNKELKDLMMKHGLDNAHFDVQKRVLQVRGDFGFYQKFKTLVDQIEQRIPKTSTYNGPTCPICFDKPSLPIRLQCEHLWCRGCIAHYFQSAKEQKTFPLKCVGNEGRCGAKIPIAIAKRVLSGSELEAIVTAAFLAYVNARPKEYHFCPTPDCPQIYRTTQQKATLQCPSCLTSICTRCHTEAHDEFQCSDQVQDDLFKKWVKDHDVKQCPTCEIPIERVEGCNHMTCTQCQTHICWQCMKTFPGGEGIYGHMREVHGTFGLGQVFD